MKVRSAAILVYRTLQGGPEVLLVHPGGPFWAKKDAAAWSIPKGIVEAGEDELTAARREAREELGIDVPGPFVHLGEYKLSTSKVMTVWLAEVDAAFEAQVENGETFSMEWPPRSGKLANFPEVDRAEWFSVDAAAEKLHLGQRAILPDLMAKLSL